jgi:hypothetical protein
LDAAGGVKETSIHFRGLKVLSNSQAIVTSYMHSKPQGKLLPRHPPPAKRDGNIRRKRTAADVEGKISSSTRLCRRRRCRLPPLAAAECSRVLAGTQTTYIEVVKLTKLTSFALFLANSPKAES